MKKILTTAVILGSLYGTANATVPITSPIFMPCRGDILMDLDVGYYQRKATKGDKFKIAEGWQADLYGKVGVNDYIALNYDFDLRFLRKHEVYDVEFGVYESLKNNAKFENFSFGITGRVVNEEYNKFDIIFDLGQTTDIFGTETFPTADLALRYGLDLDYYNMGLSARTKYYVENKDGHDYKTKKEMDFGVLFENEFIISDYVTIGLDLSYDFIGKEKNTWYEIEEQLDSYNQYGGRIDLNYEFVKNNYVGAYFSYYITDLKDDFDNKINPETYSFGLRYVSLF